MRKSTMFAVEMEGGPNLSGKGHYLLYLSPTGTVSIDPTLFTSIEEAKAAKNYFLNDEEKKKAYVISVETLMKVVE